MMYIISFSSPHFFFLPFPPLPPSPPQPRPHSGGGERGEGGGTEEGERGEENERIYILGEKCTYISLIISIIINNVGVLER